MLRNTRFFAIVFASTFFLFTGCGGGSSSAGTSGTPTITLSASSLTFPSTTVGQTSAVQTVTVANTGNGTAIISGITISGNTVDFAEPGNTCASTTTLAAGSFCTINFTFTPQSASSFSVTITATDNASNSPQSLTLTGTGAGTPAATLSTAALAFPGTTSAGSTSSVQNVTLTNGGTAALAITSIVLDGANPTDFSTSNNCGASLAASSYCTVSVTFSPAAASTTYSGVITVTDNAGNITGSQQLFTLSGTSTASAAPTATLSANVITFTTTTAGTTTAAQSVTLMNSGTTALGVTSIALSGNTTNFATTNTCGSSVAANGGTCTISATFSPTAAVTANYTATITLTDNANNTAGSQQTIALSGSGTTSSVTRTFYVFGPSAPAGITGYVLATPLYTFINSAKTSIDMTMYELQDTIFSGDLVTACSNGVKVRVILSSSEKSNNTPAYNQLNAAGANCSAVFSNSAFENTHQKTITIDGSQTAILSLNLQTQYYSTSRDFALIENDTADIAAIEATFNTDWAAGGTNSTTDFNYVPGYGDTTVVSVPSTGDLIWSPINAQTEMLRIINNAKSTLYIENEEMSASNIVTALETACTNGVKVYIAMVNSSTTSPYSSYSTEFKALEAAGCGVRTYPDTSTGLYIHAKAVVADYGLSTQAVYMGSINYSTASMTENRELGIYIADPGIILTLYNVLVSDYNGATTF